MKTIWSGIAIISLGLGILGAFLPLLPTTPFLLLSVWSGAKANPEWEKFLIEHPRFGPPIVAWKTQKAISLKSKILAVSMLVINWIVLWYIGLSKEWLIFLGFFFFVVIIFLLKLKTFK